MDFLVCPDCGASRDVDVSSDELCDTCQSQQNESLISETLADVKCPECHEGRLEFVREMSDMEPAVRCLDCGFDLTDATLGYFLRPDGQNENSSSVSSVDVAVKPSLADFAIEVAKAMIFRRTFSGRMSELEEAIRTSNERADRAERRVAELEAQLSLIRKAMSAARHLL